MFVQPSSGFLGRCEARTGRVLLHSQHSKPAANKDLHWSWWVGWASARTTVRGGYALYAGGLVNMHACVCVCVCVWGALWALFSWQRPGDRTLSWGRQRFKWAINQTEANEQLMALNWDSKHPMNSHLKRSVRWNRGTQVISEQGLPAWPDILNYVRCYIKAPKCKHATRITLTQGRCTDSNITAMVSKSSQHISLCHPVPPHRPPVALRHTVWGFKAHNVFS